MLKSELEMEKINCIFWGVNENKIRKQTQLLTCIQMRHSDRVYPQESPQTQKQQQNHYYLFVIRKLIFSCLLSSFYLQHSKITEREVVRKETETNISWYSSVYERNVIPSKPNQKLYIFSLAFYYFFHFIPSLNTSLKYSDSYNLF